MLFSSDCFGLFCLLKQPRSHIGQNVCHAISESFKLAKPGVYEKTFKLNSEHLDVMFRTICLCKFIFFFLHLEGRKAYLNVEFGRSP